MRYFHSTTSPFARKVLMCAMIHGLDKSLEIITVNPLRDSETVFSANPLGKVPALLVDDGGLVPDSPLICRYLDGLAMQQGDGKSVFGNDEKATKNIILESFSDGVSEAAFSYVMEAARPDGQLSTMWQERRARSILGTLKYIAVEYRADLEGGEVHIGKLALAAALGYLDFRIPGIRWRVESPYLVDWLEEFSLMQIYQETAYKDGKTS